MRLALVHEWISERAGAEKTFEALAAIFPTADLYAVSKAPGVHLDTGGREIRTTLLDRPVIRNMRAATLPSMPIAWQMLEDLGYDAVITSHHAFAHANNLAKDGPRLSYVHSPARYVWSPELDARGSSRWLFPVRKILQRADYRFAQRVDSFAANSSAVAARIERYWGREASVIHPPVRADYFSGASEVGLNDAGYILGVGRWVPYKNLHLIAAVAEALGIPAKVAGSGPERRRIMASAEAASVPVEVIESPSDERLRALYQGACALVFPTVEDFGIVPVEAQAAGTPVVAPRAGGVLDSVIDGSTGILVDSPIVSELAAGVRRAEGLSSGACRENAARFGYDTFAARIRTWTAEWGIETLDAASTPNA
ncbi:MAG: glycosyltransferase [Mycobacterium sp.]|nr:glycosyltransferase [Mycobacterium sp.]